MDLRREHFRAMILYDFKCRLKPDESYDRLQMAFMDEGPSKATVYRWYNEFKRGRPTLGDDERSGRPLTAVTEENVLAVKNLIQDNRRITYQEIQHILKIGSGSVHEILHSHLRVRRIVSRWVPHNLTDAQKQARVEWCRDMLNKFEAGSSRRVYDIVTGDESWIYQYDPETKRQSTVWVFQNEPTPTKVKRSRSGGKILIASFFNLTGHLVSIPLRDQRSINAEWYTTKCLPEVFSVVSNKRPNTGLRGLLLHHDNAPAHTALKTRDFLDSTPVKLLGHPPYSPDLAPCDFFLFPKIKNQLKGIQFSSPEDALAAFEQAVNEVSAADWKKCFENWFRRMNLCIEAGGKYFEKI